MSFAAEPRVFSIVPGVPFLAQFAADLLAGRIVPGFPDLADPLSLSQATIFLPTRRAVRALYARLAEQIGGESVLMPRIVPLADMDDAEIGLGLLSDGLPGDGLAVGGLTSASNEPPAIGEMERRLILTQLVLAWARRLGHAALELQSDEPLLVPASPTDALALAGDVARLMDGLATEDVPWTALATLVEERYDRYYGITLEFLKIATERWPAILAERGASDPMARRNRILAAEAEHLARQRPATPMIVAGSTGSVPATARLIAAISRLPNGAVVLPGLDQVLDDPSWEAIGTGGKGSAGAAEPQHGHPQAALHRLLKEIGVARAKVRPLGLPSAAAAARTRFVSEALRPAATTELWAAPERSMDAATLDRAFDGLAIVEAAGERSEALAAALALREALEVPGRTTALVTPDRGLARRVAVELQRWGITVEDSAGTPLSQTPEGRLARLVAELAASHAAPRALLALLTHPLATFGMGRGDADRAAAALEIGLLRGPAPPAGLAGLLAILPSRMAEAQDWRSARPLRRLADQDWRLVERLLHRLRDAFAGFRESDSAAGATDLVGLARHHRVALEDVSRPAEAGATPLFDSRAGEELAALFDDLAGAEAGAIHGRLADYPAFFDALAAERPVRMPASHRRVKIWGLLEARLLEADRLVLGGLDEGVWPPAARTDAFLNRPMRAALGLAPPERRIGQTAHDFTQALGTRDIVITRALKRDGAPTVPSRFLQRMQALAGKPGWDQACARGAALSAIAARLDDRAAHPDAIRQAAQRHAHQRPVPKPPPDLVPRSLSVTEVETLVRDPYAVFARHVLKLEPLEELAVAPGAADRGSIVHEAFGQFAGLYPHQVPDDALARLLALGRAAFARLEAYPDVLVQWWPRFTRLAAAFVEWERQRRPNLACLVAEVSGRLALDLADGSPFVLRARADRIERRGDGGLLVVDFKTGAPPSNPQIFAGFAPQLTLEAAMLRRGAFAAVAATDAPIDLLYVHASGGARPLENCPVKPPQGSGRSVEDLIEAHLDGFSRLMSRYVTGEAGFMARPFAEYAKRFNAYDHLSRVGEWSATGGVDAEAGEGA